MTPEQYGDAYQRGYGMTVRFLVARGVQHDEAKDVAQTAWVKGWERLAQLRNGSLVTTWVNSIALNVYRKLTRSEPVSQMLLEHNQRTAEIDLAAIDIARVLSMCRPSDRHLLEMRMNGATTAEIACQQGVTNTTTRVRLLRARRNISSRLEGSRMLKSHTPTLSVHKATRRSAPNVKTSNKHGTP